jgi:hypothetical protein
MAEPLFIFVVYNRPSDYPDEIIVRKFTTSEGDPVPLEIIYRGKNLMDARSAVVKLSPHAIHFTRSAGDERQIMECWI